MDGTRRNRRGNRQNNNGPGVWYSRKLSASPTLEVAHHYVYQIMRSRMRGYLVTTPLIHPRRAMSGAGTFSEAGNRLRNLL